MTATKTKKRSSSSTSKNSGALESSLANVPKVFRDRIIKQFEDVRRRRVAEDYQPLGMAAGHLAETVLRLLQHEVLGTYTAFGTKIANFGDECRKIIVSGNATVAESLRVVLPRALVFVYTVRNKRGVGHVGGDVDANKIDSETIARTCDWIVCELVRVYHGLSLEEAQDVVDGLAQRQLSDVWHVAGNGKKRVLRVGLTTKQQVLLLCYQDSTAAVPVEDLCDWVEYSNLSVFKAKVIKALHVERLVEYDKGSKTVILSPKGSAFVEATILKTGVD